MLDSMNKLAVIVALAATACSQSDDGIFTLYRDSVTDDQMRVHVAAFDSLDGAQYNHDNCYRGIEGFRSQITMGHRFWCEKGRFRR